MDLSFGKNRLRITAVTNTNATQFSANTALMILGKCANISGHCVNPSPMLSDRATIVSECLEVLKNPPFPCKAQGYIQLSIQIIQTTVLGSLLQEY